MKHKILSLLAAMAVIFNLQAQEFFLPPYTIEPVAARTLGQEIDYWHPLMKTAQAWQDNQGEGTVVFILDTGLPDHVDLPNAGNAFAANTTPEPIADGNGHASACGGVVAAQDNDYGALGIAPKTLLVYIKVMRNAGVGYSAEIAAGIRLAADMDLGQYNNRLRILSMSFGGSSAMPDVADATKHAKSKGCILVASAGNSGYVEGGNTIGYPARYDWIVSVGSIGKTSVPSNFSSGGQGLKVTAFGEAIYTTNNQGGYWRTSGTSFSGPMVAGVCALVGTKHLSAFKAAGANAQDIMLAFLTKYAKDLPPAGYDPRTGYGLPEATILSNAIPAIPPPGGGETPTRPERTIGVVLANTYTAYWRPQNGSTLQKATLTMTVNHKSKYYAMKAIDDLAQYTAGFWTNRGFVLLKDDDLAEAAYWFRYFYELISKQQGFDTRVALITVKDDTGRTVQLRETDRRTTAAAKAASNAYYGGSVSTIILEPVQ